MKFKQTEKGIWKQVYTKGKNKGKVMANYHWIQKISLRVGSLRVGSLYCLHFFNCNLPDPNTIVGYYKTLKRAKWIAKEIVIQ